MTKNGKRTTKQDANPRRGKRMQDWRNRPVQRINRRRFDIMLDRWNRGGFMSTLAYSEEIQSEKKLPAVAKKRRQNKQVVPGEIIATERTWEELAKRLKLS